MPKLSMLTCVALVGCTSVVPSRASRAQAPDSAVQPVGASAKASAKRVAGFTGFTIRYSAQRRAGHEAETNYPEVDKVLPESPAARAGVQAGDIVLEVNGQDARVRGAMFPVEGVPYLMRVRRGDTERELMLTPVAKA